MKVAKKPEGAILGYGRVSREGQDLAQQRAALRAAGCTRLFEEKASGGRWDRPERLLGHLRPGDVVVVWKLYRLSRSKVTTNPARAGDAWMIGGHLGGKRTFDAAIGAFAFAYADPAKRDHATLKRLLIAVKLMSFL